MSPFRIRAIRVALGLTQDEFADRLKVVRRTVIRWETPAGEGGHSAVQPGAVRKILDMVTEAAAQYTRVKRTLAAAGLREGGT